MELQEFIKNTLISIKNGVHEANEEFANQEGKELGKDFSSQFVLETSRGNKHNYITFDVAVMAGEKKERGGGASLDIKVASIGGEIGDIKTQQHVSRIQFHIIPHQTIG